jgi:hypothetical protein
VGDARRDANGSVVGGVMLRNIFCGASPAEIELQVLTLSVAVLRPSPSLTPRRRRARGGLAPPPRRLRPPCARSSSSRPHPRRSGVSRDALKPPRKRRFVSEDATGRDGQTVRVPGSRRRGRSRAGGIVSAGG